MTTVSEVTCRRCGQTREALSRLPLPGPLGEEIRRTVCLECWREWERAEVMVINELKLNFMDPTAQQVLEQHMREFLALEDA
ncbi:MAG TPA: oxidative damage protection protein [Thermoanaerobaculia bacterium]|jgi:Fe-S cluster biosynthesis and repair protein YggX|nr:oxidative damage protection protein [Thermoanaerobaculia bacterium]